MSINKIESAAVATLQLKTKENNNAILSNTELDADVTMQEFMQNLSVIEIEPAHCAPWKYHNRDISWLNRKKCMDLITSISKMGQQSPILVRKAKPGSVHKYDVIYGVRRWFACKEIGGQNLLANVTDKSDRECMILMHIENAGCF